MKSKTAARARHVQEREEDAQRTERLIAVLKRIATALEKIAEATT